MTDLPAWLAASHAAANPRANIQSAAGRLAQPRPVPYRNATAPRPLPRTMRPADVRANDPRLSWDEQSRALAELQRHRDMGRTALEGQAQAVVDPEHTPLENGVLGVARAYGPGAAYDAVRAGARVANGDRGALGNLAMNTGIAALPFLGLRGMRGEPAPIANDAIPGALREIDDSAARVNYPPWPAPTQTYRLGELLDHPNLYAEHPDLPDLPVVIGDARLNGGSYGDAGLASADRLVIDPSQTREFNQYGRRDLPSLRAVIAHETQHHIDRLEGRMVQGGGPEWLRQNVILPPDVTPESAYERLSTEQTAHAAERRIGMTAEQRAASDPFTDAPLAYRPVPLVRSFMNAARRGEMRQLEAYELPRPRLATGEPAPAPIREALPAEAQTATGPPMDFGQFGAHEYRPLNERGHPVATEQFPFGFRPNPREPTAVQTDQFFPGVADPPPYNRNAFREEDVPTSSLTGTQSDIRDNFLNPERPGDVGQPISTVRTPDGTYIINGHHRVAAAVAQGEPNIRARVYDTGPPAEAPRPVAPDGGGAGAPEAPARGDAGGADSANARPVFYKGSDSPPEQALTPSRHSWQLFEPMPANWHEMGEGVYVSPYANISAKYGETIYPVQPRGPLISLPEYRARARTIGSRADRARARPRPGQPDYRWAARNDELARRELMAEGYSGVQGVGNNAYEAVLWDLNGATHYEPVNRNTLARIDQHPWDMTDEQLRAASQTPELRPISKRTPPARGGAPPPTDPKSLPRRKPPSGGIFMLGARR